ncbi:MAG: HEAT repeat domain-containing protein [Chitinispirillia bacterium]
MNQETEIRALIPNYPVSNFESAKRRILLLESLCFQLKTSEDLAKLELKKALNALKKNETREKQILEHITNLENKIIEKNRKIQEIEQKLSHTFKEKTEALETIQILKNRHELENEIALIRSERKKQSSKIVTEKLNHCEKRLNYLEPAFEKLFDKMMQLYDLSQNGRTENFDLTEFIAELRAEILSLKQKISNTEEREFFLKEAYDDSIKELLKYKSRKIGNSETRWEPDSKDGDKYDDPDEIQSADSENRELIAESEFSYSEETADKKLFEEFRKNQAVPEKTSISRTDRPLIDFFMNDLTKGSDKMRPRAAARLIDLLGEQAVPVIVKTASSTKTPYIKVALIAELAKIRTFDSKSLISIILYFLDDEDSSVRSAALDAFSQFAPITKKEHFPIIQKAMEDESSVIRRKALIIAATSKEIDPGVCCKQLLQDPDHNIRRLAVASFNSTKDPKTVMALFDVVKDENDKVSATAANTLYQIFGDVFEHFSRLKYENRVALVDNFTTYITIRFNSFFPNGNILPQSAYSLLFPPEMRIQKAESKQIKEMSREPINKSGLKKESSGEKEERKKDVEPGKYLPSFDKLSTFIQSSLMGCTIEEIGLEFSIETDILSQSIDQYISNGKIVKRGKKLFLP